ncbi:MULTISPECIES: ATP-binding protein [Rhodomicrobium]|uniref:ATP-binding protein n=1 Tax=Rhodomicrobium TaxID=1068 RepID=UPI000B4BDFE8|nr:MULTISPECIES: ATP-binding protein [Rhodomicrobium]
MPARDNPQAERPTTADPASLELLQRIAGALERLAPPAPETPDFEAADAFIWQADRERFLPVAKVNKVPIALLQSVEQMRDTLLANTERFAKGLPANNALLWGARGMGKSSLVKAVHAAVRERTVNGASASGLKLVEIHREDIASLPACLAHMRASPHRFIVFCDDLSFDADDTSYKSLKAVLEGGIEGRPENVIFYATSNRRHLMPRDMMENERSTSISPSETVEEKVSLSDRFGLWIGFHNCSQADYLAMVHGYADHFGLTVDRARLEADALQWSMSRGGRSGRVAWQFIQDAAGREGKHLF